MCDGCLHGREILKLASILQACDTSADTHCEGAQPILAAPDCRVRKTFLLHSAGTMTSLGARQAFQR